MFENFVQRSIPVNGAIINLRMAGSGEPVLLLHGYPQTHVCWHLVAPILVENFTVVCSDLRGYGDSSKPASDSKHLAYSKQIMARDQVAVMNQLGFKKFAVVGHDRGARVAHRMALDFPDNITKLALLDIIPTSIAFENVNKEIATNAFNWFFSIQDGGLPEKLIGSQKQFYLNWCITSWKGKDKDLDISAIKEYERCFDDECIRATCEEFRAAASIDLEHDADGKKIACPVLTLWSLNSMWSSFNILEVWRTKADNVRGRAFECGHFLPEEMPDETANELLKFLG